MAASDDACEAILGSSTTDEVRALIRDDRCRPCNGIGRLPRDMETGLRGPECDACSGTGRLPLAPLGLTLCDEVDRLRTERDGLLHIAARLAFSEDGA